MPDTDKGESITSAEEFITRRKMMAASSVLVAGGLAGCNSNEGEGDADGNGNGGTNNNGGNNGGGGGDTTITTFMQSIPTEMNWNTWAPSYPWTPSWLFLEPVLRFYADGSTSLELIEDWDYNPDTQELTVNHNQEFYWWNGDVANAADKYWYGEVARLLNPDSSSYEALHLENNGNTIIREYKEPQNPELVNYGLGGYLGAMHRGHRDKFRPWAEELQDATTDEERLEIEERMAEEMPLSMDTFVEEGLGTGPFQVVDYDEQGIYCELFEDHPYADQIEIDKFDYMLASSEAVAQRMMGGDFDFGFGTLSNWIGEQNPSHLETIAKYKSTFMRKLEFMMDGPGAAHMRTLEFRRALANVINLQFVSDNYAPESAPREAQTGLPSAVTDEWLGDYASDFIDYPVEADEGAAVGLLESAGYQQDGDSWLDSGGEQVSLQIVVPTWADNPARTVADQLSNFGFEIDLTVLEGAAFNDRTADNVDFDMTMGSHGALVAHPSYYFRPTHKAGNDLGDGEVIADALANGEDRSPYNGKELIVEIPEDVGQEDLSGSTREVNLYELFLEWQTAQTEERSQEIAQTFTWFWNFYVPGIDQFETMNGSWGNVENWNYDVNQDWEAYRGAFRAVKRGHISPK